MFSRYQVAGATSTMPSSMSGLAFEGTVNPGVGRNGGGFFAGGTELDGQVHGEVEEAHPLTGENGYNPSLSSQNHALNCAVELDSAQRSKSEILIPRGKIAWFYGEEAEKPQRWKNMSFSNRQKLNAIKVVFGGTDIKEYDEDEFTWCLPAASATFVPGRAHVKSNYITFATADSTEIFLDTLDPTHFDHVADAACKVACMNPGAASTRGFAAGSHIWCSPRKNGKNVLGTMVCADHIPAKKSVYLGVLKVPYSLGDQSITVALCLSH